MSQFLSTSSPAWPPLHPELNQNLFTRRRKFQVLISSEIWSLSSGWMATWISCSVIFNCQLSV